MILLLQEIKQSLFNFNVANNYWIRNASKKSGSNTRNQKGNVKPKHRGWRVQNGTTVQAGTILATQKNLRFHPGLNVGFGRNGTLFAVIPGKVMITCEEPDLNWNHNWVQRNYGGRMYQNFYKKYFNVIPDTQHQHFKLVDKI